MANEENVKKDKKEKKENLFTKIRKAPSKFAAKHPKLTKGISVTGKVVGGVSTVITAIAVKRTIEDRMQAPEIRKEVLEDGTEIMHF